MTRPILVLDEPTAALDPLAEHELFKRLRALAVGRTVLLISHRFSTVRSADRILVFDKGCLIEVGNHDELMATKRPLRRDVHHAGLPIRRQLTWAV